jgi:ferric-dicitrate binding protein FerR (iron transport regulator)
MKDENEILINDELIVKYLTGEADPEEAIALQGWLESPDNHAYFISLQATWERTYPSKNLQPPNRQKVWNALEQQLGTVKPEIKSRTRSLSPFLKIAASLLILITAATLGYFFTKRYNFSKPVSIYSGNELREMVLPDSSQVVLSRNSTITYDQIKGEGREVSLSGEAFFNVKHNPHRPFVIHTQLADIKVLGTSFNVAQSKDKLDVSVAKGKVLVITPQDSAYLESGRSATVEAGVAIIGEESFNDENNWAYATRKFNFKNTRLAEVFRCIEKSFPFTIDVRNKAIENCRLTANFENTSADYMVSLIAETLDLSVTKNDHVFILEGNGCE